MTIVAELFVSCSPCVSWHDSSGRQRLRPVQPAGIETRETFIALEAIVGLASLGAPLSG